MILLPNCTVTLARSTVDSYGTSMARPYGPPLSGHLMTTSQVPHALPTSALESEWMFKVEVGTDIQQGDVITAITLNDGITLWPAQGLPANTNEFVFVCATLEATPGSPLSYREIYFKREVYGGVATS